MMTVVASVTKELSHLSVTNSGKCHVLSALAK